MRRRKADFSVWLDISGLMLSSIFILALVVR
jgi:hypothetical protein